MNIINYEKESFEFLDFFKSKEVFQLSYDAHKVCERYEEIRAYYMLDTFGTSENGGLTLYGICYALKNEDKHRLLEGIQNTVKYSEVTCLKEVEWYFDHIDDFGGINMRELEYREKIREYVEKKDAYKNFEKEVRSRILGQPDVSMITFNVFMWLKSVAYNYVMKNNIIIAGPSGSGKTETYRVIEEILTREIGGCIPVIRLDLTMLTSEGFSGMNNSDFFASLIDKSCNGIAIVVLDEMDKRMIPSHSSSGENVNQAIQSQILTVIEGIEISNKEKSVDTNNTLFIGAGSFESIRTEKMTVKNVIGFNIDALDREDNIYECDITMEDIVSTGALSELIGRFTYVVNYKKLSRNDVGVLVKRYADEFSKLFGYKIKVDSSAIDMYYEEYCISKFGCRIIRSNIYNKLVSKCREIELMGNNEKREIEYLCVKADGTRVVRKKPDKRVSIAV